MPHLLVVEDEAVYRQFLVLALQLEGYSVSTVGSGEKALDFLHANVPDLVTLDLGMPNISGWDVLRFMRGTAPLDQTPGPGADRQCRRGDTPPQC